MQFDLTTFLSKAYSSADSGGIFAEIYSAQSSKLENSFMVNISYADEK